MFKNTTILLPAMDETFSLEKTVEIILSSCNRDDICEIIIIVCNRSTEECKNTAVRLCEKYSEQLNIYVHHQTKPFVGGAIQEGFMLAQGSHVVLMSSDLETDPEVVGTFIEESKQHPDCIVTASRWIDGGGFNGYNKVKLFCNYLFEKIIAILFFVKLTDLTYAFRIFPTKLVRNINWEESKHPFFLETALKPIRLGIEFVEVPAKWKARTEGCSQNSFWANFKYFKTACKNRFMKKELIIRKEI